MSRRPGRVATPPPPPSSGGDDGGGDNDGEKSDKLSLDAVLSIRSCYRMLFAAVGADVFVTFVDGHIWTKLFGSVNGNIGNHDGDLNWDDASDVIDSFSLLALAIGLMRTSWFYQRAARGRDDGDENFVDMLRTMSVTWGVVALNFAVVGTSMAAALPSHSRGGPLEFILGDISSTNAAITAVSVLIALRIFIGAYCLKRAWSEDEADDKRISLRQMTSKSSLTFEVGRRLGYLAYLRQALCVGSFGFMAAMELLKWASDPDAGVVGRVLSVSDVLAPFALAYLLFTLNRSFLRAAIARLRDDGTSTTDDEIYNDVFTAQITFYSKVTEAMKDATIYRLLPYAVRPFLLKILSALEAMFPVHAAKIVEVAKMFL